MKKILIHYWNIRTLIPSLEQGSEFEYSQEKLNEIIQIVFLENNLNVMLVTDHGENNDILVMIDKGKFRQS